MMPLVRRYNPSVRMDCEELDGLLNALGNRIEEADEGGDAMTVAYLGAWYAVDIIRHHEFVETQEDFLRLFDKYLQEAITIEEREG